MNRSYEVFGSLGEAGCYRLGIHVALPHPGGELPERCVVCNEPTRGRVPQKLVFRPAEAKVLIFIAPLVGLLLAASQSQTFAVPIGLCDEHAKKHRQRRGLAWALALGGIAIAGLGAVVGEGGVIALGALIAVVGAPIAAYFAPVVRVVRVDGARLVLSCGLPFVASLPEAASVAPAYVPGPAHGGAHGLMHGPGWVMPPQQGFGGR